MRQLMIRVEGLADRGSPAVPVGLATIQEAIGALTPDEHRTWSLLRGPRRKDWLVARVAARRAAQRLLGDEFNGALRVIREPGRAPRLIAGIDGPAPGLVPLRASWAHRHGRAVAVVDAGQPVGIDLERVGVVSPGSRRYFLTARESASGLDLTSLWALKEAAWKALECSDTLPFRSLEILYDGEGEVAGVRRGRLAYPARAALANPWPGYILAVLWLLREDA
jgi:4'-phosphopantetheinyl transferase EntD